jgi:hypothetical protein
MKKKKKKDNPHIRKYLTAAKTLDDLVADGGVGQKMLEVLRPIRDLLLANAGNLDRCWCTRCERDRFSVFAARISRLEKSSIQGGHVSEEHVENLIQELHGEVVQRYPMGIAARLYEAMVSLYLSEFKEAENTLLELADDEVKSLALNGEEVDDCRFDRCSSCGQIGLDGHSDKCEEGIST